MHPLAVYCPERVFWVFKVEVQYDILVHQLCDLECPRLATLKYNHTCVVNLDEQARLRPLLSPSQTQDYVKP